jgi:hypothetical protein
LSLNEYRPDPLDGAYPTENRRQQIAQGQVFNLPVAIRGADHRALQKALTTFPYFFTIMSTIRWLHFRQIGDEYAAVFLLRAAAGLLQQ